MNHLSRIHLPFFIGYIGKPGIVSEIPIVPVKLFYCIPNTLWRLKLEWTLAGAWNEVLAATVQPVPIDVSGGSFANDLVHPYRRQLLVDAFNEHGITRRSHPPPHFWCAEGRVVFWRNCGKDPPLVVGQTNRNFISWKGNIHQSMTSVLKDMGGKAFQGFLFDDTMRTIVKDMVKPKGPQQSDLSYGSAKAIPVVTTAIGALSGEMVGGRWGAMIGADIGAHAGVAIEGAAEKRREKVHHITSVPSQPHPTGPPIASPDPSPPVNNYYIIYGGPGAGVPQYPHEPVIYGKRGRGSKTHRRRKTSR
jgi:hypothetical protein